MSYEIVFGRTFKENVRRLERRFPHVKMDVAAGVRVLRDDPRVGAVIPRGHGTRKLRLLSSDLRTGKRGGFRLIYLVEDQPSPASTCSCYTPSLTAKRLAPPKSRGCSQRLPPDPPADGAPSR